MNNLEQRIINWLANGEVGISSEAIAFKMLGINKTPTFANHPRDPEDIRRCFILVDLSPEIRNRLGEMREISGRWSAIVNNWDKIRDQLIEEVGDYSGDCTEKKAPKTCELMRSIYKYIT